ncbi:MAG TPA: hypothetical protein ENK70_05710 [Methylophaga sp.]|nr:hypothetical protein [Methylophaga sp.]
MKNRIFAISIIISALLLTGCKSVDKLSGPPTLPAQVVPMGEPAVPTSVMVIDTTMGEVDALFIAETECIKGGESVGPGHFNENSKTWWFDANLNTTKEGCNPACVVSEDGTFEINWRCTGLKQ